MLLGHLSVSLAGNQEDSRCDLLGATDHRNSLGQGQWSLPAKPWADIPGHTPASVDTSCPRLSPAHPSWLPGQGTHRLMASTNFPPLSAWPPSLIFMSQFPDLFFMGTFFAC
jgi:hypothetical protein